MFKVLFIAYYFPPMGLSGVQRALKFAKYMPEFNWMPTVLTAGDTAYYAHDQFLLQETEESKIRIVRTDGKDPNSRLAKYGTVNFPRESIRKLLSRISKTVFIPDNKTGWAKVAHEKAKEILSKEKFDVIFVTIPPYSSFPVAAQLKKEFNLPLFVDYRDLWLDNQFAFYPTPYHRMKHKQIEDSSLRGADKIITVNRRIKEKLLVDYKFLSFDDIMIIPHGYDKHDFEIINPVPKVTKKMIIAYSGIFYEGITPKYLLQAMHEISIERPDIASDIELHFIGHFRKENRKLVTKYSLQKMVREHGYLNHKEALEKIVASDVLWVMLPKSKNMDKVSAGKLFEYFGTRKPILASLPEGASLSAAKEYGSVFVSDPESVDSIKTSVYEVYKQFKNGSIPEPNEEFIEKLDRKLLTEQLTKEFQFFLKEEG